jgi:hypothetical protein
MKRFTTFAFVGTIVAGGLFACSSDPDPSDTNGGHAGTTSTAGTIGTGGSNAGGSLNTGGSGINTQGGSAPVAGTAAGGTSAGGTAAGGTAAGGTAAGGTAAGGTGGSSDNPNAVVSMCAPQTYTPTATPGAACATTVVPAAKLISDFENAVAGWGIYRNMGTATDLTGVTPNTAPPTATAGGANATAKALAVTVANVTQGIRLEVGYGTQCQDVRTFKGLSFWAKGTIDAATEPYAVDANTIVLQVGAETSKLGGCTTGTCADAPPDKRITISADWKEYRIPFDCFGDGKVFDGYYRNILFNVFGTNSNFAIDQVGYYN